MLTENRITDLLVEYFKQKNFNILTALNSKQKGIDVVVEDLNGLKYIFEVKGETSASETSRRFGKPFTGNQIWTHVSVAILKMLTLINDEGYYGSVFALALPLNHKELIQKIKPSLITIGIKVYLVSELDVVEYC